MASLIGRDQVIWVFLISLVALFMHVQISNLKNEIETLKEEKKAVGYEINWVDDEEGQEENMDATLPLRGLMRMEWQTPIYQVNSLRLKVGITAATLKEIETLVMLHYDSFVAKNVNKLNTKDSTSHRGVNQAFFLWQRDGGAWDSKFKNHPAIAGLPRLFHFLTDNFLSVIGVPEDVIRSRSREVQVWATVNQGCIGHPRHTHPNNMLSGVMYISVPEDAGDIVFSDPRGPYPGLDGNIRISPQNGDVLLFPSWLGHEVLPTVGDTPRISIAFNMPGEWADTASVAAKFPLQ